MVNPLVDDTQRAFNCTKVSKGIFCKYSKSKSIDHFWNTMINFWVKMIWTACKNNTVYSVCNDCFKSFLTSNLYIFTEFFLFSPGSFYCIHDLFKSQCWKVWMEFFKETVSQTLLVINRKEWIQIKNARILTESINIVAQNFWVACYNRTVVVVSCSCIFLLFIRCTWIENEFTSGLQ